MLRAALRPFLRRTEKSASGPPERVRPRRGESVQLQIRGRGSLDIVYARDIGPGGVGVYLPHAGEELAASATLELVITLPGERPFVAEGIVRHVNEDDESGVYFGVEFTKLDDAHREALHGFVAARL